MKKKILSIVIPNWNGADVIADCLKSIERQSVSPLEVIVVENGSIDNSAELIKEKFPKVRLIQLEKNIGFAGGVNVGIKAAKGEYVFLLNNDAELEKDTLKNLIKTVENENADITQCVILTDNGKLIDSVGDEYSFWGLPYPGMRNYSSSNVPKEDKEIFSASGGASLYKMSLFKSIGYFDERFFAYYEDVDISMRSQLANKKLVLSSKAIVHHKMNHTSNKIPGFGREMAIRNSIFLFWKNLPFTTAIKVFPRLFYCNMRMTLSAIIKGHPFVAVRAHLVALVNIPRLITEHHKIMKLKKITSTNYEEKFSNKNPFKAVKKI